MEDRRAARDCIGKARTRAPSAGRPAEAILVPGAEQMVVLVSDGLAEWWPTGAVFPMLRTWGSHHPTSLATPLPSRLWASGHLPQPIVTLVSPRAGSLNATFSRRCEDPGTAVTRLGEPARLSSITRADALAAVRTERTLVGHSLGRSSGRQSGRAGVRGVDPRRGPGNAAEEPGDAASIAARADRTIPVRGLARGVRAGRLSGRGSPHATGHAAHPARDATAVAVLGAGRGHSQRTLGPRGLSWADGLRLGRRRRGSRLRLSQRGAPSCSSPPLRSAPRRECWRRSPTT